MKSLFNDSDNLELINRIKNLTPDSKPQWGKMDVPQMLAHCTASFKTASGELKPKSNIFLKLIGKTFKNKLLNAETFRKNSPTADVLLMTLEKDFETERDLLISHVVQFKDSGKKGITDYPHAFFGKLNPDEWDLLMTKHLNHHLKQFGV